MSRFLGTLIDDADLDSKTLNIALRKRAVDYLLKGLYEEAVVDFTQAIEINPQQGIAFAGRGDAYRRMSQNEKALADLTRATELSPSDAWILLSRGMVHQNTGRHEEALADYEKAIALDPKQEWILGSRGQQKTNEAEQPMLPVTIYLSDAGMHSQVEMAVTEFLTAANLQIAERDDPILGSWFRRMQVLTGLRVERESALTAAHVLDSRLIAAQDAQVTATLLQNLPPVLQALQTTKDAVLRVGALLIVKVDWAVQVFQLTASQQALLDHSPQLAASPHEIITALGLTPMLDDETQVNQP